MKRRIFITSLIGFVLLVVASGVFWAKNLPSMTVKDGNITVTNCELPMPKYAKGVCPKLYCKKAVIESGLFPEDAQIGFAKTNNKKDTFENIVGAARYQSQDLGLVIEQFQCEMDGYKVVSVVQPD